ncbi:MAG: hypothetical protein IT488_13705 [Gammaproteobacteria bacterium]|jgi:phage-related minor tail protein|nr:hypothetical protein [Gammaproteobacteria bacterium]
MALEDLADLIRANSANTNRRLEELHAETYGQLPGLQNDVTDVRSDVKDLRQSLDLTGTVAEMKRQIEALAAEVAALKRRA